MKNITLSVDEETYRLARITAAARNTSVSALVREYLQGIARTAGEESDPAQSLFSTLDRAQGFRASSRLTREQAHGR